jgi:hypothetical protein
MGTPILPVAYGDYVSDGIEHHITSKLTPATATLDIIVVFVEDRTRYQVIESL